jgi:hypothetical protein
VSGRKPEIRSAEIGGACFLRCSMNLERAVAGS